MMNTYRQQQDRRTQDIQAARQPNISEEERRRRQQQQQQAPRQQQQPQPQQPQGQPIPLNRAGGESFDQGQQMTMEDAIRIASQYGAVPSRISSGAADPNNGYMGVWAIPTAQGWVPLGGGNAGPAPSAPSSYQASTPTSTSDRARGQYGPGSTPGSAPSVPSAPAASPPMSGMMTPPVGVTAQGPPTREGVYPQFGTPGQGASISNFDSPSTRSAGSIGVGANRPNTAPQVGTLPPFATGSTVGAGMPSFVPPSPSPSMPMADRLRRQYEPPVGPLFPLGGQQVPSSLPSFGSGRLSLGSNSPLFTPTSGGYGNR